MSARERRAHRAAGQAIGALVGAPIDRVSKAPARAIGWNHSSVRYWKLGERRIPDQAARKVRELAGIGQVGNIIRNAVKEVVPGLKP